MQHHGAQLDEAILEAIEVLGNLSQKLRQQYPNHWQGKMGFAIGHIDMARLELEDFECNPNQLRLVNPDADLAAIKPEDVQGKRLGAELMECWGITDKKAGIKPQYPQSEDYMKGYNEPIEEAHRQPVINSRYIQLAFVEDCA